MDVTPKIGLSFQHWATLYGLVLCTSVSFKGLIMVAIHEFYKALAEQLGLERQKQTLASSVKLELST